MSDTKMEIILELGACELVRALTKVGVPLPRSVQPKALIFRLRFQTKLSEKEFSKIENLLIPFKVKRGN